MKTCRHCDDALEQLEHLSEECAGARQNGQISSTVVDNLSNGLKLLKEITERKIDEGVYNENQRNCEEQMDCVGIELWDINNVRKIIYIF